METGSARGGALLAVSSRRGLDGDKPSILQAAVPQSDLVLHVRPTHTLAAMLVLTVSTAGSGLGLMLDCSAMIVIDVYVLN